MVLNDLLKKTVQKDFLFMEVMHSINQLFGIIKEQLITHTLLVLRKSFKRFPSISELTKVKEFTPSRGSVIFFQSTPNSYHGVTLFREEKGKKRFFIYGSYALSKPVVWKYKNVSYLPKIKKTNKKLLTSSHDSDYFMKEAV